MFQTNQHTIKKEFMLKGISLHNGDITILVIKPAPVNTGIIFYRTDLSEQAFIHARADLVQEVQRRTVLQGEHFEINTIEHLLAALYTQGIDNAICTVNTKELPVLDGSSKPYIDKILQVGLQEQNVKKKTLIIKEKMQFSQGDSTTIIEPYDGLKISCQVSYPNSKISQQEFSLDINANSFIVELSEARTFCTYDELSFLFKNNLSAGGNLSNANILHKEKIYCRGKMRYKNELVRHKMLDILGDFALLGHILKGHIIANKPGHAFNNIVARNLMKLI